METPENKNKYYSLEDVVDFTANMISQYKIGNQNIEGKDLIRESLLCKPASLILDDEGKQQRQNISNDSIKKEVTDDMINEEIKKRYVHDSDWHQKYGQFRNGAEWMRSLSPVRIAKFPTEKDTKNKTVWHKQSHRPEIDKNCELNCSRSVLLYSPNLELYSIGWFDFERDEWHHIADEEMKDFIWTELPKHLKQ